MAAIEDRIRGSLAADAINGNSFERSICEKQMKEAADEIVALRATLAAERARLAPVIEEAKLAYDIGYDRSRMAKVLRNAGLLTE